MPITDRVVDSVIKTVQEQPANSTDLISFEFKTPDLNRAKNMYGARKVVSLEGLGQVQANHLEDIAYRLERAVGGRFVEIAYSYYGPQRPYYRHNEPKYSQHDLIISILINLGLPK